MPFLYCSSLLVVNKHSFSYSSRFPPPNILHYNFIIETAIFIFLIDPSHLLYLDLYFYIIIYSERDGGGVYVYEEEVRQEVRQIVGYGHYDCKPNESLACQDDISFSIITLLLYFLIIALDRGFVYSISQN